MRLFRYFIEFWEDLNLELFFYYEINYLKFLEFLGNRFKINVILFSYFILLFKPVISSRDVTVKMWKESLRSPLDF